MIRCKNSDCVSGHCCVECDIPNSQGPTCSCEIAECLLCDKELIAEKCQYAEKEADV